MARVIYRWYNDRDAQSDLLFPPEPYLGSVPRVGDQIFTEASLDLDKVLEVKKVMWYFHSRREEDVYVYVASAPEKEDFDTEVLNLARKAAKKWKITLDRLRDFELEEKEENKEIG